MCACSHDTIRIKKADHIKDPPCLGKWTDVLQLLNQHTGDHLCHIIVPSIRYLIQDRLGNLLVNRRKNGAWDVPVDRCANNNRLQNLSKQENHHSSTQIRPHHIWKDMLPRLVSRHKGIYSTKSCCLSLQITCCPVQQNLNNNKTW